MKDGKISVKAENILPIIKKWLYSDKDIFLREAVSNASDAIFKFERLVVVGQAEKSEDEKFHIDISVNKDKKTLKISDNGIGMTEEEVVKYIAQVAFSGAVDFVEKYKDQTDKNGIIGHFGLGFYSVFMVSDLVEIDTLSFQKDAKPVKWICDGGSDYQIGESERTQRGTTVTLHISDDSIEFLDESKIRETLKKYCSFISYEIILNDECKKEDKKEKDKPSAINDVSPLWLKNPKDCTDDDYKKFYRDVFHDYQDPLFWIHLNVDYPFQLKGIIYFPKLRENIDLMDMGEIKLYYNQVFVADNIKEILPDFLMVLKGVIDCPDIPINVSRSFLQNDGSVAKISNLISKKISDKLHSIFKENRGEYEKCWDDINVLIKYGCIKDSKFFDRMKDAILFKTTDEKYITLEEYPDSRKNSDSGADTDSDKDKEKDKNKKIVYYTDNKAQQSVNIELFKNSGFEVVEFKNPIDQRFAQELEMKEDGVKFSSVVSELPEDFVSDKIVNEDDAKALSDVFKKALSNDKLEVKVQYLKDDKTPALLTLSEQSRRFAEMSKMYGGMNFPVNNDYVITLNRDHPIIKKIVEMRFDDNFKGKMEMLCRQVYDIALMSHREFSKEEKEKFIDRSYKLLEMV